MKKLANQFIIKNVVLLTAFTVIYGCSKSSDTKTEPEKGGEVLQPVAPLKRVSNRASNVKGDIYIAEYHRITPQEGMYARSIENFKKDLQTFYDLGFRPATLIEFVENKMKLPPGATPVVLTFDDSSLSQFNMLADGTIDPNCAVGILKKFSEEHPDFPMKATFFILPTVPFAQKGFVDRKLAMLKQWGCEIGSHTMTHHSLKRMSEDNVKKELGQSVDWIRSLGFEPKTMCVPYGDMPKNNQVIKNFTWNGKNYGFKANVRSMGRPCRSMLATKPEDPLRMPRLIASDQPLCLADWLNKAKKGEVELYVQP